ncbi:hypothetical protein ACFWXO_30875 [Kitasatospora sp. NPDC059088]|uniref:hypothetical protein n=1 Tax=Kitasatospora sp. NPDC059088 TaxID=3346722 RepID=UPI0036C48E9D
MSFHIDPRDRAPAPSAPLATAELGDFMASEHDSTLTERPQWRRYRIVHVPTGAVITDYAMDQVPLVVDHDSQASDQYASDHPGMAKVRRLAVARYESARRALGLAEPAP